MGHQSTKQIPMGYQQQQHLQCEAFKSLVVGIQERCTAYSDKLERIEVYNYIDRLLSYDDNATHIMYSNLRILRWMRWAFTQLPIALR